MPTARVLLDMMRLQTSYSGLHGSSSWSGEISSFFLPTECITGGLI